MKCCIRIGILLLAAFALLTSAECTCAQPWVRATSSVRALGMRGAGSVLDDPWAGTINPGALAPAMRDRTVFSARTGSDMPLDVFVRNALVAVGGTALEFGAGPDAPCLVAAYAYRDQRAGIRIIEEDFAQKIDYIDDAEYSTASLAFDYGIQLGAGFTRIQAYNSFTDEVKGATDYGLLVRVPLVDFAARLRPDETPPHLGAFTPELTVAGGYVWASRSGYVHHPGVFTSDLPEYEVFGLSATAGLAYRMLSVVQVTCIRDVWDHIYGRKSERIGWEFSAFGAVAVRFGHSNDGHDFNSASGFSVHLRGAAQWTYILMQQKSPDHVPWYLSALDVYYDHATSDYFADLDAKYDEFGVVFDAGALFPH